MQDRKRKILFESYIFDPNNGELFDGKKKQDITPRDSSVLLCLLNKPGTLITKKEINNFVWKDTLVSEGVLKTSIKRIRKALGDDFRNPKFIETVKGRGYRFLAETKELSVEFPQYNDPTLEQVAYRKDEPLIGRDKELSTLFNLLNDALAERTQAVFVSGKSGIGKSFLVEEFSRQVGSNQNLLILKGYCINDPESKEAYYPILTAFHKLFSLFPDEKYETILRRHAPMWLIQFPWLLKENEYEEISKNLQGISNNRRMLREFNHLVEVISSQTPLILIFEDLQWSDSSTLLALVNLVKAVRYSRILIIGIIRQEDNAEPVLSPYYSELIAKNECRELALSCFSKSEIKKYLERKTIGVIDLDFLTTWFFKNTEGLPLFVSSLYEYVHSLGWPSQEDIFTEKVNKEGRIKRYIPESLRALIQDRINQLPAQERKVLEDASIFGEKFNLRYLENYDETYILNFNNVAANLENKYGLLKYGEIENFSDGSIGARYSFSHSWIQKVVYEQLPPVNRLNKHCKAGLLLEKLYSNNLEKIAPALATHFENGKELKKSVKYRKIASHKSLKRYAVEEAIVHLNHCLRLLPQINDVKFRNSNELESSVLLGNALVATKGYAHPSVETVFKRAHELCLEVEVDSDLLPVLYGLCIFYMARGDFQSGDHLKQLFINIARHDDTKHDFLCWGYTLFCMPLWYQGRHIESANYADLALEYYDPLKHQHISRIFGADGGITSLMHKALSYWLMGYTKSANDEMTKTIELSEKFASPFMQSWTYCFAGWLSTFQNDFRNAERYSEMSLDISNYHDIDYWKIQASILNIWSKAKRGDLTNSTSLINEYIRMHESTGAKLITSKFYAIQADCHAMNSQIDPSLSCIEKAIEYADSCGEYWWKPELLRTKGELLIRKFGQYSFSNDSNRNKINKLLQDSVELTRNQSVKSLELRATLSHSKFLLKTGKNELAKQSIHEIINWFTDHDQTSDLNQAKELLNSM